MSKDGAGNDTGGEQELQDILLTKKELKAIRKYDREQKKKDKILAEHPEVSDETIESSDIKKIKAKLDNIPEIKIKKATIQVENELDGLEDNIEIPTHISQTIQKPIQQNIPQQKSITAYTDTAIQQQNSMSIMPDLVTPKRPDDAGRVIQNQVASPPIDESGDVDLNKLFSSEVGNESEVVKELFSQDNIKVKTDITSNEISIISRLELQASMTQNFFLAKVLKELETLRVSKDRKSRSEFVQSFSGIRAEQSGATAFGKLSGIFKNDKV